MTDIEDAKDIIAKEQEQNAKAFLEGYKDLIEKTGFECVVIPQMIEIQPGVYAFKPEIGIKLVNGRNT